MHVSFKCAYQGQFDYKVEGRGRIEVRVFAYDDYHRNFAEVAASVGSVRLGYGWADVLFPPEEVVALFPGFVAARYNPKTKQIEYRPGPRRSSARARRCGPSPNCPRWTKAPATSRCTCMPSA